MRALANVNGVISAPEDAKISVFDRGFLFGDAVYETGRSFEGCCLYLEEHFTRLRRSASKLMIPVPWSDEELKEVLYRTARELKEANLYFRMIVSRGRIDHVSLAEISATAPSLVVIVTELPKNLDKVRKEGISLLTSRIERNATTAQDPNIKTSNYLNSLLALQDVKARGGDDAILCNRDGFVAEGTTFAIFGVTEAKTLITPAIDVGILESITRRHVLELARPWLSVKEGKFSVQEFQACREVFIASSVREIVPVRAWDSMKYAVEGEVTKRLQGQLRQYLLDYVKTAEHFT